MQLVVFETVEEMKKVTAADPHKGTNSKLRFQLDKNEG